MPMLENSQSACVALVTCSTLPEAETIAKALVTEKLAACVSVVGGQNPVQSYYLWEGVLESQSEVLLLIKTHSERLPQMEATLKTLHSYTVPEILVLPVQAGNSAYMAWMAQNLT